MSSTSKSLLPSIAWGSVLSGSVLALALFGGSSAQAADKSPGDPIKPAPDQQAAVHEASTAIGGNPQATTAEEAHKGTHPNMAPNGPQTFFRDPGSIEIADQTCGQCHPGYAYRVQRSLTNTEAGKIQGNLHTWGIEEVQNHNVPWGNYDVQDPDGSVTSVGTQEYKDYMTAMIAAHPKQFPTELKMVPQPSVEEIEADPKLAGFTYQRQQCQRCHVGARGREKRAAWVAPLATFFTATRVCTKATIQPSIRPRRVTC